MDRTELLARINQLSTPRKQLDSLIKNDFVEEAGQLIERLVSTQTAGLWYERPSSTTKLHLMAAGLGEELDKVILFTHRGEKLLPTCAQGVNATDKNSEITVGLAWLHSVLKWDEERLASIVTLACKQAVIRPVSNWGYWQALGTRIAARTYCSDELLEQVDAAQLSYHLRSSQFHKWDSHWPLDDEAPLDMAVTAELFNRIADYFVLCGWTEEQVKQEFLTWMRLNNCGWPHWVAACATSDVFHKGLDCRLQALRKYFYKFLDEWRDHEKSDKFFSDVRVLMANGLCSVSDRPFVIDYLADHVVKQASMIKAVEFTNQFALAAGFIPNNEAASRDSFAQEVAESAIAKAYREQEYQLVSDLAAAGSVDNLFTQDAAKFAKLT